ncbi:hypothetical protein OA951_01160, partial [Bacteroidota bacterium]|nr:hypothetical protein [Bacteroidota bacterium]
GYSSGFLQIINLNSNSIVNIYDILNKPTIPADRKKINHFYQNGEELLISTGYGISVYDINAFEFGDTYYIGNFASMLNISSAIVDENYIYASTPDLGIKLKYELRLKGIEIKIINKHINQIIEEEYIKCFNEFSTNKIKFLKGSVQFICYILNSKIDA